MDIPANLKYSADHEWIQTEDQRVRIGITDFAQDNLGDIVFVQIPEVGSKVEVGAVFSEVESTKSVSDIFAPVNGTIVQVNADLEASPELLNSDPYGAGWICVIEVDGVLPTELLDASGYEALVSD